MCDPEQAAGVDVKIRQLDDPAHLGQTEVVQRIPVSLSFPCLFQLQEASRFQIPMQLGPHVISTLLNHCLRQVTSTALIMRFINKPINYCT